LSASSLNRLFNCKTQRNNKISLLATRPSMISLADLSRSRQNLFEKHASAEPVSISNIERNVMFDWLLKKAGAGKSISRAPWEGDKIPTITASFVIISLTNYIISDLKGPRGVHTETMMTMIGALAGFSAQYAIWETIVKPGKLPEHGDGAAFNNGAFVVVKTETAETFYFGDLLNSYLVPTSGELAAFGPEPYTLWAILAAGVKRCGKNPLQSDQFTEIFRHAASNVGTPQFGRMALPNGHQSSMTPQNALNRAWPHARAILARTDIPECSGEGLPVRYWPPVIALTAQGLLEQAKNALDPNLSMLIAMAAAIPMSKVDPTTVP
jgi:hypothetical protein